MPTTLAIVLGVLGGIAATFAIIDFLLKWFKQRDEPPAVVRHVPLSASLPKSIPHNLPPRVSFIGREKEMARVLEGLASPDSIVSIEGLGGIGKSALALEAAYHCLERSRNIPNAQGQPFEGLVWVSAKDREISLDLFLDSIARTLGYTAVLQLPILEKQEWIRRLFGEQPLLLIFDNLDTCQDPAIPAFIAGLTQPSKAIITTRVHAPLPAWTVALEGLTKPEGMRLIQAEDRRLGLGLVEKTRSARLLEDLYHSTNGLPLAIKWAIGQVKQKGQSLDSILAGLRNGSGKIFDDMFAYSWSLLGQNGRAVLSVLPVFDAPALLDELQAASGLAPEPLSEALGQLVEMSLVATNEEIEAAKKRYNLHPLTRSFVSARTAAQPGFYAPVFARLADHYQKFCDTNGGIWNSEGYARLEPELPNIIRTLKWCWEQGDAAHAAGIFEKISHFMVIRGDWNEVLLLAGLAIRRSDELGDFVSSGRFRSWPTSWISYHRGEIEAANRLDLQAVQILEAHPSDSFAYQKTLNYTRRNLGRNAAKLGQYEQAKLLLAESLEFYQSIDEQILYSATLGDLAAVNLAENNVETARVFAEKALAIAEKLDDPERAASALNILAEIAVRRNQVDPARNLFQRALRQYQRTGRVDSIAETLLKSARLDLQTGSQDAAANKLKMALSIFRSIGMEQKAGAVEDLLAQARS